MGSSPESAKGRVLIVDDDEDIAQLARECLADEGYGVTILRDTRIEAIQEAVARHEPNCILLDGGPGIGYGDSWATAALMTSRTPPIPTIMFTAHTGAVDEAMANVSERSLAAGLTAVLLKPFELNDLMSVVEDAVRRSRELDQR